MLKSEEAENVLLVEKKENKQLRTRNGELEVMNKSLREKLVTNSTVDSQLKLLIDENNKLKVSLNRKYRFNPLSGPIFPSEQSSEKVEG